MLSNQNVSGKHLLVAGKRPLEIHSTFLLQIHNLIKKIFKKIYICIGKVIKNENCDALSNSEPFLI